MAERLPAIPERTVRNLVWGASPALVVTSWLVSPVLAALVLCLSLGIIAACVLASSRRKSEPAAVEADILGPPKCSCPKQGEPVPIEVTWPAVGGVEERTEILHYACPNCWGIIAKKKPPLPTPGTYCEFCNQEGHSAKFCTALTEDEQDRWASVEAAARATPAVAPNRVESIEPDSAAYLPVNLSATSVEELRRMLDYRRRIVENEMNALPYDSTGFLINKNTYDRISKIMGEEKLLRQEIERRDTAERVKARTAGCPHDMVSEVRSHQSHEPINRFCDDCGAEVPIGDPRAWGREPLNLSRPERITPAAFHEAVVAARDTVPLDAPSTVVPVNDPDTGAHLGCIRVDGPDVPTRAVPCHHGPLPERPDPGHILPY